MPQAERNMRYRNHRHRVVERKLADNQVVNLSRKHLTPTMVNVLTKGMKFVPGTVASAKRLYEEVELKRFKRNLRLRFHFIGQEEPPIVGFPVPSSWQPPEIIQEGIEEALTKFETELEQEIGDACNMHWSETNLRPAEWVQLNRLRKMQDIVIKPADKGGAIVVMDRDKYLEEGYKNLARPEYYETLARPAQPETIKMVTQLLFDMLMSRSISVKEYTFLKPPIPCKPRVYYQLPKIQKPRNSWPDPAMPTGRPIVANVGTELTNLSKWVDYWIQEPAQKLLQDSVVKDSYDFLERLEKTTFSTDVELLIIAADVKDLYTNIPHKEGIAAVMEAWKKPSQRKQRPKAEFIERALKLILERNDMEFAGKYYLQKRGVAMGTNCAPAIANIYMEKLDTKVREYQPLCYFRFLDDLIIMWDNHRTDLDAFKLALNAVDQHIQLVFTESLTNGIFLDVELMVTDRLRVEGKLDYKVYIKPSDTLQLLHHNSCHPRHTFRGIVKSQVIRHKRLSSQTSYFDASCQKMFDVLTKRGYLETELLKCKAEIALRNNAELQRSTTPPEPTNFLIMTWNPVLRNIPKWARERWEELHSNNPTIGQTCPKKLVVSWKRPKNVQEMVVRAAVNMTAA